MNAQLGIVGLGRIGANLARMGVRRRICIAGYTLGTAPRTGRRSGVGRPGSGTVGRMSSSSNTRCAAPIAS